MPNIIIRLKIIHGSKKFDHMNVAFSVHDVVPDRAKEGEEIAGVLS